MDFRTELPLQPLPNLIDYESKIVSLGSCFAVNMAHKFKEYQFPVTVNPFGILFHPKAIETLLDHAVSGYVFTEQDVFCHQDIWSCFDAHSDLNQLDASRMVEGLNNKLQYFIERMQEATHAFLTFGTAWGYYQLDSQRFVANCHKIPQHQFDKNLSSVVELQVCFQRIFELIRRLNPKITITVTLSPVRHLKDGFIENQRSKAHLLAALHEVLAEDTAVAYFPAYELVLDELRDYRFYKSDMIHPNEVALDYIWECFVKNGIDIASYPIMKKVREVQQGLNHRSFNPTSDQHALFLDALAAKIDFLLDRYPFMNFR